MAEAHTEQRLSGVCTCCHQIKADAGFIGRAGARRYEITCVTCQQSFIGSDGIVTHDFDLSPQFHQVMDQVEGKAVVIVDYED